MIKINCQCGKELKAPDTAAGRTAKCPSCGRAVTIPMVAGQTVFYKCPSCKAKLESASSLIGQQDLCPICKHLFTVPDRRPRRLPRRLLFGSLGIACLVLGIVTTLALVGTGGTESPPSPLPSNDSPAPGDMFDEIERLN